MIIFSDRTKALLPLSFRRFHKGLTKRYISSPAGTFGGWISADSLGNEHGLLLQHYLMDKIGDIDWCLNPYEPHAAQMTAEIKKGTIKKKNFKRTIEIKELVTDTLYLEKGFDLLFDSPGNEKGRAILRKARKAEESGITVKPAVELKEWEQYYNMYRASLDRWGDRASSVYEWEMFDIIYKRRSKYIKLWTAWYGSEPAAGALCFYSPTHVVYWHGAAQEKYFSMRPVNALMVEIIKHACENKYRWFDFNPSGKHEGVRKFKQSFGASELHCPVISVRTAFSRLLER